jgi:hypothetical protein
MTRRRPTSLASGLTLVFMYIGRFNVMRLYCMSLPNTLDPYGAEHCIYVYVHKKTATAEIIELM